MLAACTTMARLASRRKLLTRFARSSDMRRSLKGARLAKSYDGGSQGAEGGMACQSLKGKGGKGEGESGLKGEETMSS